MENSSRLRPYVDTNNTSSRVTFQKGEKVEAFWSTDGQKYPGTIVHVYPNDNYEVLFNDGVKSRKKASQIFKLKGPGRPGRPPNSKSVLPSSRANNLNSSPKPLPALIPVKGTSSNNTSTNLKQNSSGSTIPPPPPLIRNCNNESSSRNSNESDSPSSSRTASPYNFSVSTNEDTIKPNSNSLPKPPKLIHNNINSKSSTNSCKTITTTTELQEVSEGPIENPSLCNNDAPLVGDAAAIANSTKKGFVYVQQPHYSVFDIPATDLGKRRRRVHNYSMLARGPPLKGGLGTNIDDIVDGESISQSTSRSNSPVSSPSLTLAISSPSTIQVEEETKPTTPTTVSTFTRRRRFLTSPTGKPANRLSSTPTTTSNKSLLKTPKEPATAQVQKSSTTTTSNGNADKTTLNMVTVPSLTANKIVKKVTEVEKCASQTTKIDSKSKVKVSSVEIKSTDLNNSITTETSCLQQQPEASPSSLLVSSQSSESDDVPTKRLRKPSFKRFSADEGYIDIFSKRRNSRSLTNTPPQQTRRQRQQRTPTSSQEDEIDTPKSQRAGPKDYTIVTKSRKTMGKLLPENSKSKGVSPSSDNLHKANNCDQLTKNANQDFPREAVSKNATRNHKSCKQENSNNSDDEELLDVGEYTVIPPPSPDQNSTSSRSPNKKLFSSPKIAIAKSPQRLSPLKLIHSPPISKHESPLADDTTTLPNSEQLSLPVASSSSTNFNDSSEEPIPQRRIQRRRGRGRGRKWQIHAKRRKPVINQSTTEISPPPPAEKISAAKVVLDKLSIPEVQILVEKCDSIISSKNYSISAESLSSSNIKSIAGESLDLKDLECSVDDNTISSAEPIASTSETWKTRRKKWGDSKNRWNKTRARTGGLLPSIRPGMRANDHSLTMQLIKRSRLQRRYEKRGRPKVAILTGITKKRLKKIQESVKRRKLRKKKVVANTKFKDVRVDIINCVCGRTDEFGLMVQCEVCLCWQHGGCFQIHDGSALPKFYVCESCSTPKSVRSSHTTEGVRQETYKKGVLPTFPFARKPSGRKQRIIKKCSDLAKVIDSIDDTIRQNKIKEVIALAEPDHPKLYQWSSQRVHPKDLIQKWNFNKYFKAVVRRLLRRHKCKAEYIQKLSNIIGFREKLKKYAQAFEEARLAIGRKIGTRGLILIEKLSEQQYKMDKLNKVMEKSKPVVPPPPVVTQESSPINKPPMSIKDEKLSLARIADLKRKRVEKLVYKYGQVSFNTEFEDTELWDFDSDNECSDEEQNTTADNSISNYNNMKRVENWAQGIQKNENQAGSSETLPYFHDRYKPKRAQYQIREEYIVENDEWIDVKKTTTSESEDDLIKLMLEKNTRVGLSDEFNAGDAESEGEATLSGETTVSVVDSEGGEAYWYNPLTELNPDYGSMRRILLRDFLHEDDRQIDKTWKPTGNDVSLEDSLMDIDLKCGFQQQNSDSDESVLTEEDKYDDDDDDLDTMDKNFLTSEEDSSEEEEKEKLPSQEDSVEVDISKDVQSSSSQTPKLKYWQRAILELEKMKSTTKDNDNDDENDSEWIVKESNFKDNKSEGEDNNKEHESMSEEEEMDEEFLLDLENEDSDSELQDDENCMKEDTKPVNDSTPKTQNTRIEKHKNTSKGVALLTSDASTSPGEIIDVCVNVGKDVKNIGRGLVIAGVKGQHFIKMLNPILSETSIILSESDGKLREADFVKANSSSSSTEQVSLVCKSCLESLGSTWTWSQLKVAKRLKIAHEDTLQTLKNELNKMRTLGMLTSRCNVGLKLNTKIKTSQTTTQPVASTSSSPTPVKTFDPRKLTEICRDALTLSRNPRGSNALVQSRSESASSSSSSSYAAPRSTPPTSAEEESILSLLSLSKTPVQFNGENVSELSIESLRKLTDRLQHNGPLSEDLAKAVGQPLANGKIALQRYQNSQQSLIPISNNQKSVLGSEQICLRCSLKNESSKTLTLLTTIHPELAETIDEDDFIEIHQNLKKAVKNLQGATHVIKRSIFKKVSKMVERKKADRTARILGLKKSPYSLQQRIALTRPDEYLNRVKTEYVDALMPYATYFISRFTKKDELSTAKRNWVNDMLQNYNKAKRSLKEMYGVGNEEGRVTNEDKFYTCLDNLRKSFDIVLTKKDIKLRRQTQSLSSSDAPSQNNNNSQEVSVKSPDSKTVTENSEQKQGDHVPPPLVNGDVEEKINFTPEATLLSKEEESSSSSITAAAEDSLVSGKFVSTGNTCDSNNKTEPDPSNSNELEMLAQLTCQPIGEEDVDILLGITNELSKSNDLENTNGLSTDTEKNSTNNITSNGGEAQITKDQSSSSVLESQINKSLETNALENGISGGGGGGEEDMEVDDLRLLEENLALKGSDNLVIGGDFDLINTIGDLGSTGDLKGTEDSELLLNVFEDPIFSEPADEPKPCCSKSLTSQQHQPPKIIVPVLAKLTPEMCRGHLLEDIRAHQQIIDGQLDKVESEIMELERRRGNGLREKDDEKLFEMLFANMQILIGNMDVLKVLADSTIGTDNKEPEPEEEEGNEEETGEQEIDDENETKNDSDEEMMEEDPDSDQTEPNSEEEEELEEQIQDNVAEEPSESEEEELFDL